jgi:iron complex outermembrane receptor protein
VAALLGTAAALFLVCPLSTMHGQSVDYGALEQLFKEPVTTSVNGSPQRVSDVPATMVIITADDIRRSGAKDIAGVLRHVGGVDTLEWGNDDVDVSIRGYDQAYSSRLLVLVDGRQVYADDYGYTPWSTVPVELAAIRQIEIIKGPNSALFGFNAAGGVINIITYNPLYDKENTACVTGGTQGLGEVSVVKTAKFGNRTGVRLSIGGGYDEDFSTAIPPAAYLGPRKDQYREAVDLDAVIRLNEKVQVSFEGTQSISQANEIFPSYQFNEMRYRTFSLQAQLVAETRIGLVRASAYTNWLRMISNPGELDQPFHPKNRVSVVQVEDVFGVGPNHIVRIAGEYRHNTENTTPVAGGTIFYDDFAVSGMWDWKISPTISLTNAVRVDRLALGRDGSAPDGYPFKNSDWNRSIPELTFNSGLVWKVLNDDSVRFMISRGAELPSLVLSGGYLQVTPYVEVTGSPFLHPSPVTNYEIGWDHVMPRPHILLRGSVFDQATASILSVTGGTIVTDSAVYAEPANIGNSDARGVELGLKGAQLKNYSWSLNYRAERITDHLIPSAQNAAGFVDYQHTTPVHLLKGNLGWSNKRWEIDGYLQYQTRMLGLQASSQAAILAPVPAFLSIDGRVAYNMTSRWTWSVSGQNLTHASQIQTSGPAVERRVLGSLSFQF